MSIIPAAAAALAMRCPCAVSQLVVLLWQSADRPYLNLVHCHGVRCIVAVAASRAEHALPRSGALCASLDVDANVVIKCADVAIHL